MVRMWLKAMPIAVLMAVLGTSAAFATTVNIQATNSGSTYFFSPQVARVGQGSTALWTNTGTVVHTSTSDTSMPVAWSSGTLNPGSSFSIVFTAAGRYTYHCAFHASLGMVGSISVPVKASPMSASQGQTFTIIVASADTTGTLVYDVQKKDPGGTFHDWQTGVTTRVVKFVTDSSTPTGFYQFRARLRDTSSGKATLYSRARSISVTT